MISHSIRAVMLATGFAVAMSSAAPVRSMRRRLTAHGAWSSSPGAGLRPIVPVWRDDPRRVVYYAGRRTGQRVGTRDTFRQRQCARLQPAGNTRSAPGRLSRSAAAELARPGPQRGRAGRVERDAVEVRSTRGRSASLRRWPNSVQFRARQPCPANAKILRNQRVEATGETFADAAHVFRPGCRARFACCSWPARRSSGPRRMRRPTTPGRRPERKSRPPKGDAKEQQERAPSRLEDEDAAVIPGIPNARVWGDSASEFARLLPQASGPWLAISGGGSDGAFGAGVLTGWSESGTRPEFAVVTGVSIGALIAPFAFLGPRYDEELRKNFTTIGAADIFEDRITRDSLFDYWPLKRVIEHRVTAKLLSEIAAEHARGRRLLVATTNLDAGRRVVWNMGAIAARGDDRASSCFASPACVVQHSRIFLACRDRGRGERQEIPGVARRWHADRAILRRRRRRCFRRTARPVRRSVNFTCIVNSKLGPEFKMPDRSIAGVLGRSIAVALTAALRVGDHADPCRHAATRGRRCASPHVDAGLRLPQPRAVRRQIHAGALRVRRRGGQEGHRLRRRPAGALDAQVEQPAVTRKPHAPATAAPCRRRERCVV